MRKVKHIVTSKIKEFALILKDYKLFPSYKNVEPSIVIMFDNKFMHGGLLDRIKGIITAKMIAEELGYTFKIYADTTTFNLFKFLLPRSEKIVAKKTDLIFNVWKSKPVVIYNLVKITKQELIGKFKSQKQYHLYCNLDLTKRLASFENDEQYFSFWSNQFFQLFSFNQWFEDYYNKHISATHLCGIHLRFTSLLGDFEEVENIPLQQEEKSALIKSCLEKIQQLVLSLAYKKFLVVSDSSSFLNIVKASIPSTEEKEIIILDGNIGHVDVKHNDEVLQKAILDFYLLQRCKEIHQVLGYRMYNSQFSRYASIAGSSKYLLHKI